MANLVPFKISPRNGPHPGPHYQFYVLPATVIEFEISKKKKIEITITIDGYYYDGKFYLCLEDMFVDLPEIIADTIIFNIDIFKNL